MLPLLRLTGDQQEHSMAELVETLAKEFQLTPEDRRQMLPSGRQTAFENRVGWAKTYMKKAGLLESTGRGRIRITKRGLDLLKEGPSRLDAKFLRLYPEFVKFQDATPEDGGRKAPVKSGSPGTLEEILESTYSELTHMLAQELLERIKKCPPEFFERLVVDLLVAMGYGGSRSDAGRAIGRARDEGVDGVISEDKLGLDVIYVQAKRWQNPVGRPLVQAFAGSLEGQRARKGVMITTSEFTDDAKEYVKRIEKRIILMDGLALAKNMIQHNIGVTEVATYPMKRIDLDYFETE